MNIPCDVFDKLRMRYSRSIKDRWILSCISLSLIPVLIGIFLFSYNIKNFKLQTIQNNEVLLLQIHDLIDQGFYDVKTIVQKIAADPSLNMTSVSSKSSRILLKRQLINRLNQYRGYSSFIEDIYVYFWDTEEFVSCNTAAPTNIMYRTYHNSPTFQYEDWIKLIRRPHNSDTAILPIAEGKQQALVYIKVLPSFSSIDINATIMVVIDNDSIISLASSVSNKASCELNLLLKDSLPLLPPTPILAPSIDMFSELNSQNNIICRTPVREGVTLSALPSKTFDITYILGTPPGAYYNKLKAVNILFVLGLLTVITGSIVFTVRFIYKNYAPIKEIMEIVHLPESAGQPSSAVDEYSVIKNAITYTKNISVAMQDKLNKQSEMLFDAILTLLMHNFSFGSGKAGLENLERVKAYFKLEYFSIAILFLGKSSDNGMNSPLSKEQTQQLSGFLQKNIPARENLSLWIIEMNGALLLLFNMDEDTSKIWNMLVQEMATVLNAWWNQVYRETLLLSVSHCCQGIENVSQAYEEAEYSMKYRLVFGIDFQAQNGSYTPLPSGYYYPAKEETKLLNLILSGDTEKAINLFDEIWQVNQQRGSDFLYCLLFDILGTIVRACNLITPVSTINSNLVSTVEKLVREHNINEMRKCLLLLMSDVCKIYVQEHSKSTDKLKNEILDYIDIHYSNPSLSVGYIGDVFGKSRAYLFSLFKEATGFSMLYHINKVRIEHAKELLCGSKKPIQDISMDVGFYSSISFTRTFKKYENTTPSRYRKLHAQVITPARR